ncbi:unnamed protein product [Rhizoctonia solani]|uniref:CCHC-type domain-containing protein n=1 Tax=Rhizoctonia solani TaxID=456999 RepID=A0A8H3GRM5_9AGAM|nr:unnamed protein product [Rhizoctonia solani]
MSSSGSTITGTLHHVDPSTITIGTDSAGVIQTLEDIKTILTAMNENLKVVIGQVSANMSDIATQNVNHNALDKAVTVMERSMLAISSTVSGLAGGASSSSSTPKAPKLSEPAKFDGMDKSKAVSFRVAISHYIRVSYPGTTVDVQIAIIISLLDGKAHEWLEPYLEDDVVKGNTVSWLHDLDDFWTQFNSRFAEQNRTENFRAKLRALKQTKSVQQYFKDFQTYSQGLGYNDVSLRDMFYDGLSLKIKEMLMAQDYDHNAATVSLQTLAEKALKIDQRLEQFASQHGSSKTTSSSGPSSSASGKKGTELSSAAQGAPRDKLTVGDKVYQIDSDGRARKGTISKIGRNAKGQAIPTVKWNTGDSSEASFKNIKKDAYPDTTTVPSVPKNSGPAPMDLDSAGSGKKPTVCSRCGGRGHYASQCPTKTSYSAQEAHLSEDESEKGDL